jgi:tRNA threonylcarbamoyl adenosine modification protein YeaZ
MGYGMLESMPYLIIDTSSEYCLLGLAHEAELLSQNIFHHENNLSKTLLPCIQSLCPSPKELTAIAIGIGPGSYTGTRLGAAVAKSLAYGLQIPLIPFCSAWAFIPEGLKEFAFAMPTRSGQFFIVDEEKKGIHPLPDTKPLIALDPQKIPVPCIKATPNLSALPRFLSTQATCHPDQVELLYLHSP